MQRSWSERFWGLLGAAVMIVTFTVLKLLRDDGQTDWGFLAFACVLLALVVAGLLLTRWVGRRR
jgi:Na+/melibiose symporter-like transporter